MLIKIGFRVFLVVGLAITTLALLLFIFNQYIFFEERLHNEQLDRISVEGIQLVQLTNEVLLYGEARALEQWHRQYREVEESLAQASNGENLELQRILDALAFRFAQIRPLQQRLAEARAKRMDAQMTSILASQLFQDSVQLAASLRDLKNHADSTLKLAYARSKSRMMVIFNTFVAAMIVYVFAALALFRTVILRPLGNLDKTIHLTREGNRTRAKVRADDEIGAVCQAFNTLLDEQEQAATRLRTMVDQFRNVFEQAAVGMAMASPDGAWMEVNQCLCEILGCERDDLLGDNYRWAFGKHGLRLAAERARILLAAESDHDAWEIGLLRKDGREITARLTTALARDLEQRPLYFVTVIEDITERAQAQDQLRDSNRRLEEQKAVLKRANADLESFAWVASHDLREPLRMVSIYVDLIDRRLGANADPELREFIGYAIGGAKRMYDLIGDLLDYARIGSTGEEFHLVDLITIIAEARAEMAPVILEAGGRINLPERMPAIMGDSRELSRLFLNLIDNAVKFRRPDVPLEVTVSCEDGGDVWHIRISDNGIGIDPHYRERVFGMFQQIVERGRYEGTGIGLTICRKIVEYHGGQIWIEGTAHCGTTVVVALPKAR